MYRNLVRIEIWINQLFSILGFYKSSFKEKSKILKEISKKCKILLKISITLLPDSSTGKFTNFHIYGTLWNVRVWRKIGVKKYEPNSYHLRLFLLWFLVFETLKLIFNYRVSSIDYVCSEPIRYLSYVTWKRWLGKKYLSLIWINLGFV